VTRVFRAHFLTLCTSKKSKGSSGGSGGSKDAVITLTDDNFGAFSGGVPPRSLCPPRSLSTGLLFVVSGGPIQAFVPPPPPPPTRPCPFASLADDLVLNSKDTWFVEFYAPYVAPSPPSIPPV
jgi:hypothetical protein